MGVLVHRHPPCAFETMLLYGQNRATQIQHAQCWDNGCFLQVVIVYMVLLRDALLSLSPCLLLFGFNTSFFHATFAFWWQALLSVLLLLFLQ
jgi:hypothetical protein